MEKQKGTGNFIVMERKGRAGMRSGSGERGFTLMELIIVLAMLAAFAAMARPRRSGSRLFCGRGLNAERS